MHLKSKYKKLLDNALGAGGQRSTKQREHIFALLLEKRDHPTADEIFARARSGKSATMLNVPYVCGFFQDLFSLKLNSHVFSSMKPDSP